MEEEPESLRMSCSHAQGAEYDAPDDVRSWHEELLVFEDHFVAGVVGASVAAA